tara:strand:- start:43333 stop:44796 length:1464 start_codon:yes stop_codon:yes gene_type:complete
MSIIDQKKQIFNDIGAINVLNENFPELPSFNSIPSINNDTNSTKFLLDLTSSLVGAGAFIPHLIEIITYALPDINNAVKDTIKAELKEMVSCSVNPSIPDWVQNGGDGINIGIDSIDFFNKLKVDPLTDSGSLLYTDITTSTGSGDFTTNLHNVLQTPEVPSAWGGVNTGSDMLQIQFDEVTGSGLPNNMLNFKTTSGFSDLKLPEFNNSLIDSLGIFGAPTALDSSVLLNALMDSLYGTISSSLDVNKTTSQLRKEEEIREVINCFVESENDVIDDSFFTFSNATIKKIDENVKNRKNGIRKLKTCGDLSVSITQEQLLENQEILSGVSTKEEEYHAVSQVLENLSNIQGGFSPNQQDTSTVKNDFFSEILKNLTTVIITSTISPGFVTLFSINNQIISGQDVNHDGALEFLKKNKNLIKSVTKIISGVIIAGLLALALKHLTKKLAEKKAGDNIEKAKNRIDIIKSYSPANAVGEQMEKLKTGIA